MIGYLLPRIHKFHEANPELLLEVNMQTSSSDEGNFAEGIVDLAIHSGPMHSIWQGVHAEKLVQPELMPICSPSLLKGPNPLKTPADLANHAPLITRGVGVWEDWIEEAEARGHDMSRVDWRRGLYFNQTHLASIVAQQGWGVALGSTPLIYDAVRDGSLVIPFDIKVKTQMAYWLLCPKKSAQSGSIRAFRTWLQKELADDGRIFSAANDLTTRKPSPKLKIV
jgi:LysR family glycine cleavage system transcriptional activator